MYPPEQNFLAFETPSYKDDLAIDSDGSDIEIPARDYSDYQKKQAAIMQRRKSSAISSYTTSRKGSSVSESRRRSSSIIAYNSIRRQSSVSSQGDTHGRGSIVDGNGKGFPNRSSLVRPPPTLEEADETTPTQLQGVTLPEISKKATLLNAKSKKFLLTSNTTSTSILEKPESSPAIVKNDISPQLSTSGHFSVSSSARILPKADQSSLKNEDFKESGIKKALTGVLPMGYTELKQLSEQVSNLTHKLRMHHDESVDIHEKLILDDLEIKVSAMQSVAPHNMSIEALDNSPPKVENRSKVENAIFPGIDLCCDISGKLDVSELLRMQCTLKLNGIFKANVLKLWIKNLKSKGVVNLVGILFWYSWHILYKSNDSETLKSLFEKISTDYVGLFVSVKLPRKDFFFVKLPDFVSYAVVRLFQESFPESAELFDSSFKSDICSKICVLLSGISPSFLPSRDWEKQAEPVSVKATRTEDAKEQKRRALTQILTSAKCLDDPVSLDEKVIDKEFSIALEKPESSFFGDIRKGKNVSFNLFQNSPLVTQYLQNVARHKQILIKRTEISKVEPPLHLKTYRDLLEESRKQSKIRKQEYKKNQDRILNDRQLIL